MFPACRSSVLLEPMHRTTLPNKGVCLSRADRAAGPRLGGPFLLAGHPGYLATSRARRALKADTPFGAAESVLTRNRASAYRGTTRRRGIIMSWRSEEHTSELQSLMRISYAVFCLKKQKSL